MLLYKFMREHGVDFQSINLELVENCPSNTQDEILRHEGKWIRELNATLNKIIAGRTHQEHYLDHREILLEKQTKYDDDNRDKIRERMKKYQHEHREQILTRRKQIVKCSKCGSEVGLGNISHHQQTKKCQAKNNGIQQPTLPK